jgi:hypothetical protein
MQPPTGGTRVTFFRLLFVAAPVQGAYTLVLWWRDVRLKVIHSMEFCTVSLAISVTKIRV